MSSQNTLLWHEDSFELIRKTNKRTNKSADREGLSRHVVISKYILDGGREQSFLATSALLLVPRRTLDGSRGAFLRLKGSAPRSFCLKKICTKPNVPACRPLTHACFRGRVWAGGCGLGAGGEGGGGPAPSQGCNQRQIPTAVTSPFLNPACPLVF